VNKIKIFTDSTSDLPIDIIRKYNLEVLPLTVYFGNEVYRDGIDIKLPEFLEKMNSSRVFPTTSQVNPQTFYDGYKKCLEEGYKIISIHISSKMSGTYQSACIAKEMLGSDDIIVVDSLNVTSGLGLLVFKACILRELNYSYTEIHSELLETIPHIKSAISFESLDNLVKGGRLSKAAGMVGSILGLRLILEIRDGEIAVMDKVRGSKKASKTMIDYIRQKGIKEYEPCIILQVENKDVYETLKENLVSSQREFIECEVGCVVGTHSGSGACGIFFIENY
jgi:DegV family protein with EDD domain